MVYKEGVKLTMDKIKFRPEWFGAYGLDKNQNFLQAPLCECGCGEKASLVLEDIKELFQFMNAILMENDCNHCAIFVYAFDGCMYAALKVENETDDPVLFFKIEESDLGFFREWDDELGLHCYGLIIEMRKGLWKIIED